MNSYQIIALGVFVLIGILLWLFRKTKFVQKTWRVDIIVLPILLAIVEILLNKPKPPIPGTKPSDPFQMPSLPDSLPELPTPDPIPMNPNPAPETPVPVNPNPETPVTPPTIIVKPVYDADYQMSTHYTLGQLWATQQRAYIQENQEQALLHIDALHTLCTTILEPIVNIIGVVPHIDSAFRSVTVNGLVGGQKTSQHCDGEAADTIYPGVSLKTAFNKIAFSNLPFGQVIFEFSSWVHVSYQDPIKHPGKVRQRFTTAVIDGETKYIPITEPIL